MAADQEKNWRIDRTINLVDVVTMVVLCITAVTYISKIEQRVAIVESNQAVQKDRDERQDRALEASLALVRESITKLEAKIDRLIETRK